MKIGKSARLLTLLMAVSGSAAVAENWVQYGTYDGGTSWIDADSIQHQGNMTKAWIKDVGDSDQKVLEEFNCSSNSFNMLHLIDSQYGEDQSFQETSDPKSFSPVSKDLEAAYNIACTK
jgi:hypothetical protein